MYARASLRSGRGVVDASVAIAAAVILFRGVDGDAVARRATASRGARARAEAAKAVAARAASDMTCARSLRRGVWWVDGCGGGVAKMKREKATSTQLSKATMIERTMTRLTSIARIAATSDHAVTSS